jgi:hypothetical protein
MIAQYFPASSGNPIYFPTLASWQAYTGQEEASQTINPGFFSNVNLVPTTPSLNNLGEYLLQVPTDFAGVNRNDPSDMGALEFGNDPMVVTTEATSISPYGAILNGTVNPRENIVTTAFDYGSTTSYGYSIPAVPVQISGTNTTQFSGSVSGLKAGTVYHFRARTISNGGVISYGSDMTFMIPNLIPDSTHTSGTVGNGTDTCYNATETITVAGNGSTFTVVSGGSATFIAGQRILFLPGTTVLSGGVMTGRIATDGQYCQALSMPAVSVNEMPDDVEKTDRPDGDQSLPQAESGFTGRIYPNPVVRNFTVEIAGAGNQIPVQVMVFSMTGSKILEFSMTGETRREISAGGLEPGMYFIRFIAEGAIKTLKFIKR